MQQPQPALHRFVERLAKEKKRLEALAAAQKPGLARDEILKKLRQLDTAARINEWLTSPGLQAPR